MATISIIGSLNWGTIGWVALATVVLVVLVAAIGRGILAAFPPRPEHMSSFKKASPASASAPAPVAAPVAPATPAAAPTYKNIPMETLAVISAAVAVVLRGKKYTLLGVRPAPTPAPVPEVPQNPAANVERLMTEWSMEGRRQVYSSHDVSAFR